MAMALRNALNKYDRKMEQIARKLKMALRTFVLEEWQDLTEESKCVSELTHVYAVRFMAN